MASFETRHARRAAAILARSAAAILALGAAAHASFGSAQPAFGSAQPAFEPAQPAFEPTAQNDREQQILETIREEASKNGPYSIDLVDAWTALSLLYDEEGHREDEAAAIDQARQVVRANYGLYSLEEAPLMRRALENKRARGDFEGAWNLEQDLLARVARNPGDVRGVPILREIADGRRDVLRRYRDGDLPPEIYLGCYYHGGPPVFPAVETFSSGPCKSGSRSVVLDSLAREILAYDVKAIHILASQQLYSSRELQDLESQVIRTSYESSASIRFPGKYYSSGRQSYRRLLSYKAATSAPWLARIETLVAMTDWDLLFLQNGGTRALDDAVETYEQSYDVLVREGVPKTSIDEIFSPETPVVLPAFLPNPLISEATADSAGYVDVAFDITKYGKSDHVKVTGTSGNVTDDAQRDLVRLIKYSLFRPRTSDGHIPDRSRVRLRYYVKE
ncbi:MAG TPA: hypothetical protein VFV10_15935 [Gammaproteobacteria bacterium]|nr:hypothetical protein [Gammaproteobacteria bacterium]